MTARWSSHRCCGRVMYRFAAAAARGAKVGRRPFQSLIRHVLNGNGAMMAVDGPRGPRGAVQKGIGLLAQKTNAAVLMAVAVPSRRWIFRRTWDQFQLPKPFSCIDVHLSDPLWPAAGESLDRFTERNDPTEVSVRRRSIQPSVPTRVAA